MKRFLKSTLGVTLLEIMLVLAIAAMVIVMSIRYYQSANASQNANTILSVVQGITAAADTYAQGGNGYTGLTQSIVTSYLGSNGLNTPYGAVTSITAGSATTYTVNWPTMPSQVCALVKQATSSNTKIVWTATCTSYTYTSTT